MSRDFYWDSSFTLRTLEPSFHDLNNVTSPLTFAATHELKVPTNAKVLQLHLVSGSGSATIEVSKSAHNDEDLAVYEVGNAAISNSYPLIELPLENITYVRLVSANTLSIAFTFLLA